jgi:uncharacterized protein
LCYFSERWQPQPGRCDRPEDRRWTRDPERVALAYTIDSHWRNRAKFLQGVKASSPFRPEMGSELDYRLIKKMCSFVKIAWRSVTLTNGMNSGNWFRSYGNEFWGV